MLSCVVLCCVVLCCVVLCCVVLCCFATGAETIGKENAAMVAIGEGARGEDEDGNKHGEDGCRDAEVRVCVHIRFFLGFRWLWFRCVLFCLCYRQRGLTGFSGLGSRVRG